MNDKTPLLLSQTPRLSPRADPLCGRQTPHGCGPCLDVTERLQGFPCGAIGPVPNHSAARCSHRTAKRPIAGWFFHGTRALSLLPSAPGTYPRPTCAVALANQQQADTLSATRPGRLAEKVVGGSAGSTACGWDGWMGGVAGNDFKTRDGMEQAAWENSPRTTSEDGKPSPHVGGVRASPRDLTDHDQLGQAKARSVLVVWLVDTKSAVSAGRPTNQGISATAQALVRHGRCSRGSSRKGSNDDKPPFACTSTRRKSGSVEPSLYY